MPASAILAGCVAGPRKALFSQRRASSAGAGPASGAGFAGVLLFATSMLATRPTIAAIPMPAAAILPAATPLRLRDGRAAARGDPF